MTHPLGLSSLQWPYIKGSPLHSSQFELNVLLSTARPASGQGHTVAGWKQELMLMLSWTIWLPFLVPCYSASVFGSGIFLSTSLGMSHVLMVPTQGLLLPFLLL